MDEALNQRGDGQRVVQFGGHVAHANLDGSKSVMRADVPPDFADRVDELSADQVIDQPRKFAPVPHLPRKPGGRETFKDLGTRRVQSGFATVPER